MKTALIKSEVDCLDQDVKACRERALAHSRGEDTDGRKDLGKLASKREELSALLAEVAKLEAMVGPSLHIGERLTSKRKELASMHADTAIVEANLDARRTELAALKENIAVTKNEELDSSTANVKTDQEVHALLTHEDKLMRKHQDLANSHAAITDLEKKQQALRKKLIALTDELQSIEDKVADWWQQPDRFLASVEEELDTKRKELDKANKFTTKLQDQILPSSRSSTNADSGPEAGSSSRKSSVRRSAAPLQEDEPLLLLPTNAGKE